MTMNGLVLSIFPGIDLLGRGFEEAGYTVVRGPDPLWGGDIHRFHVPRGVFEGIIGGPPCKGESKLSYLNGSPGKTLRDEYNRIVAEAEPAWWVMEGVVAHPAPFVLKLTPRWLGEKQSRKRFFHSNLDLAAHLNVAIFEHPVKKHTVRAANRCGKNAELKGMADYKWPEMCELQGLPAGFDLPGFTMQFKYEVVGNGVPMVMARAIALAVRQATGHLF